jgi:uncharacterized iron-regulated protein
MLFVVACLATACHGSGWTHNYGSDHPLSGRIVATDSQTMVDEATLMAAVAAADIVLLGENHGNEDHHRLQARIVDAMGVTVNGVVFEMIDASQQETVVIHLQRNPGDTRGLGPALAWSESGWPDWTLYEPIAAAAVAEDGLIVAGNLAPASVDELMTKGLSALDPELVERSGLADPLTPDLQGRLIATIDEAHCGFAPAELLPAMVGVQRARDALMAERLETFKGRGKSVLIAGAEHVRRDWGVPYYLARLAPEAKVVSIAFREVDERFVEPTADLPYDFVWFTPRRQPMGFDPCDAYRQQLQRLDAGLATTHPAGQIAG